MIEEGETKTPMGYASWESVGFVAGSDTAAAGMDKGGRGYYIEGGKLMWGGERSEGKDLWKGWMACDWVHGMFLSFKGGGCFADLVGV